MPGKNALGCEQCPQFETILVVVRHEQVCHMRQQPMAPDASEFQQALADVLKGTSWRKATMGEARHRKRSGPSMNVCLDSSPRPLTPNIKPPRV